MRSREGDGSRIEGSARASKRRRISAWVVCMELVELPMMLLVMYTFSSTPDPSFIERVALTDIRNLDAADALVDVDTEHSICTYGLPESPISARGTAQAIYALGILHIFLVLIHHEQ